MRDAKAKKKKNNAHKLNAQTQQYDDTKVKKIKHLHIVQKDHFNHRSMSYNTT